MPEGPRGGSRGKYRIMSPYPVDQSIEKGLSELKHCLACTASLGLELLYDFNSLKSIKVSIKVVSSGKGRLYTPYFVLFEKKKNLKKVHLKFFFY